MEPKPKQKGIPGQELIEKLTEAKINFSQRDLKWLLKIRKAGLDQLVKNQDDLKTKPLAASKAVFLEEGNDYAGLCHIWKRHGKDFTMHCTEWKKDTKEKPKETKEKDKKPKEKASLTKDKASLTKDKARLTKQNDTRAELERMPKEEISKYIKRIMELGHNATQGYVVDDRGFVVVYQIDAGLYLRVVIGYNGYIVSALPSDRLEREGKLCYDVKSKTKLGSQK